MPPIHTLFHAKKPSLSFELFPPKTEKGYQNLLNTISQLATLKPDFISCTYGAGGGSREKTFDIAQHIQEVHHIPALTHLTCVLHTKEEIKSILTMMQKRNLTNVLALRGDPPANNPDWQPGPDNFRYSCELCTFIRAHFKETFSIGVAGFPEGHLLCPNRDQDAQYLKGKILNGAQFVITQLFFDNQDYINYVQRLHQLDVNVPILPGILPITDYDALLRFTKTCGTTVTQEIHDIFEPLRNNKEAMLEAGVTFALRQCRALLDTGAPGLHFYTLNKAHPTDAILAALNLS